MRLLTSIIGFPHKKACGTSDSLYGNALTEVHSLRFHVFRATVNIQNKCVCIRSRDVVMSIVLGNASVSVTESKILFSDL